MKNRRNYYRILHVQPEAPLEVIKASYRGLMTKLKAHPDLGGDHDAAVLINQAYAVLSRPDKRRRYDLDRRGFYSAPRSSATDVQRPIRAAAARAYQDHSVAPGSGVLACLFCGAAPMAATDTSARCACCGSPLLRATGQKSWRQKEVFGRRVAPRIAKTGSLMLFPSWPHPGHRAQLHDLSLTGISVLCDFAPQLQQILKIDSPLLAAVLQVVAVRRTGSRYGVHGALLVAEFSTQTGGFVSTRV